MADDKTTGNGAGGQSEQEAKPIQARVVAQYIKDLSFENPGAGKPRDNRKDSAPNFNLEVSVNGVKVGDNLYESTINFKATAVSPATTYYVLECVYAGIFQIENIPEQALEPFLLINGPTLLFPFIRRLAADVTREGGYPPLLLDPIDFTALYVHRKRELAAAKPASKTNS